MPHNPTNPSLQLYTSLSAPSEPPSRCPRTFVCAAASSGILGPEAPHPHVSCLRVAGDGSRKFNTRSNPLPLTHSGTWGPLLSLRGNLRLPLLGNVAEGAPSEALDIQRVFPNNPS